MQYLAIVSSSHPTCPTLSDSSPMPPRVKWACLCDVAKNSWAEICALCLRDQFLLFHSAEGPEGTKIFFAAFQHVDDCEWHEAEVDVMPGMIVAGAHAIDEDEVLILGELFFSLVLVGNCRKLLEPCRHHPGNTPVTLVTLGPTVWPCRKSTNSSTILSICRLHSTS